MRKGLLAALLLTAGGAFAAEPKKVNGLLVVPTADGKRYQFYDASKKAAYKLPPSALGQEVRGKLFVTAWNAGGGRVTYSAPHYNEVANPGWIYGSVDMDYAPLHDAKHNAVVWKDAEGLWRLLEVRVGNPGAGWEVLKPEVAPSRSSATVVAATIAALKGAAPVADKSPCANLGTTNTALCFKRLGGRAWVEFLLSTDQVPSEDYLAASKTVSMSDAENAALRERWEKRLKTEAESQRSLLRDCVRTSSTWASIKERNCARELGGEDWYAWLEKDLNASSADLEGAIQEAKAIGRDTARLTHVYNFVKRSEEDKAYYQNKADEEAKAKAAFGNFSLILRQMKEAQQAWCMQAPDNCRMGTYINDYRGTDSYVRMKHREHSDFMHSYFRKNFAPKE